MTIGIDLDEVLAQYLTAFIQFHNETYSTLLKFEDFNTYKLWMVAGFTREETMKRIFEFHKTEFFKNILPIEGAVEALAALKAEGHKLILISSRQKTIELETKQWLNKYFPGIFSKIYVLNNFGDVHGVYRTKSSVCKELNVDLMIEDAAEYARECACTETKVIIMDKPWNKSLEDSEHIVRLNSWIEIVNYIQRLNK